MPWVQVDEGEKDAERRQRVHIEGKVMHYLGGDNSFFFIFIPTWGDDPIWLYDIFQMGWNHQLDYVFFDAIFLVVSRKKGYWKHGFPFIIKARKL